MQENKKVDFFPEHSVYCWFLGNFLQRAAKMRKPPSVVRKEEDESSVESSDSEIDDDDARLIGKL